MKQTDKAIRQLRENVLLCIKEAKLVGRQPAFGLPAECQLAMIEEILAARKMRDGFSEPLPQTENDAKRIGTVVGQYDAARGETKAFFGVGGENVAPPNQEVSEWSHTVKQSLKEGHDNKLQEEVREAEKIDQAEEEEAAREAALRTHLIIDPKDRGGLWNRFKSIWSKA